MNKERINYHSVSVALREPQDKYHSDQMLYTNDAAWSRELKRNYW